MPQYCIYLLIFILICLSVAMIVFAISRMLILFNMENIYREKILRIFPSIGNIKEIHRSYLLSPRDLVKFEYMIFTDSKILRNIKKYKKIIAKISGIVFYSLVIMTPIVMFICGNLKR